MTARNTGSNWIKSGASLNGEIFKSMKNKMGSTDDLRKIGHCDVAGLQKTMSYDVVSGR